VLLHALGLLLHQRIKHPQWCLHRGICTRN
jgi:hypothetical protein